MTAANHQDHICMSMITAGAAVLAAVFFVLNIGNPGDNTISAWIRLTEIMVALTAMVFYGLLVIRACESLMNAGELTGDSEVYWKRERTRKVLAAFWFMVVATGFLAIIKLTVPIALEVLEPGSEPQKTQVPHGRQLHENGAPVPETAPPRSELNEPAEPSPEEHPATDKQDVTAPKGPITPRTVTPEGEKE